MAFTIRQAWKLHRFELLAMLGLGGLLTVGAVGAGLHLSSLAPPAACLSLVDGGPILGEESARCPTAIAFLTARQTYSDQLMIAFGSYPFIVGVLLGAPLVAREVDHRTGELVWATTRSRTRWLAERVVPILIAVLVLTAILGWAANYLEQARYPGVDPGMTFRDYGLRDFLLTARGIVAASIGVLVGAILGRLLPAVILAAALAVPMFIGGHFFGLVGQQPTVVDASLAQDPERAPDPGALIVGSGWQTPSGRILSDADARATVPTDVDRVSQPEWLRTNYTAVQLVLPGDRFRAVESQEAMILVGMSAAALGLAGFVVERRRPY